ncbi:dTDP-4-dehydrorhamnose reductase [Lachnospiraceae bacterium XBB2008]|nr:dTDP-4-dehydrorhamnose reductase [Lachnospiraceae bacterium XBB2008]
MNKIIVTGANGQLGRAVNIEYSGRDDFELVNTDVAELDITDIDAVQSFVREIKPYAIINCAAHTNVDACETQVDLAYRINAIGPRNLAIAARENGAKLMHISTDYVFDGHGSKPYIEFDATGPQSVYGASKLAGENMVKQFGERFYIVRTAWLYGDGKNFARTMMRLSEDHDEIRVVNDQVGSPTSARELAKCVVSLLDTDNYGLFHGTCEGDCSWADFATEVLRLAGSDTKIIPITSEEYGAPANRPNYSILDNYMLRLTGGYTFADWHDAIEVYMKDELAH